MTLENKNSAYDLAQFSLYYLEQSGGLKNGVRTQRFIMSLIFIGWTLAIYLWLDFPPILGGGLCGLLVVCWNSKKDLTRNYQKYFEKHYQPPSKLRGHVNEKEVLEITPEAFVIKKEFSTTSTIWSNVQLLENADYWFIFITPISAIIIKKSEHTSDDAKAFIARVREESEDRLS